MGLFGFGKKTSDKVKEDRELVEFNATSINSLIVLADDGSDDNALIDELKELQEKLKYLIASEKSDVVDKDKKIKNLIEDIKVYLAKGGNDKIAKVESAIKQIKLAVADRSAYI